MAEGNAVQVHSIEQSLRKLADALPLHAEESNHRESVHQNALVKALIGCGVSTETAVGQIALIRRIFSAMGVLDCNKLNADEWAFVSFPAMLLAKSTIETLSTPGQQFFIQGYWTQGKHRTEKEEDAQRELVSYLEDLRSCSHPHGSARPIRFVHVAWGFIKIDGRFALHRREDKSRPGTKRFVPPGGRVIPEDLPQSNQMEDTLRSFWSPGSALPTEAYDAALKRELAEELSLHDREFRAVPIHAVTSFLQVEGSANHRAYTQYRISVYSVELTRPGELVFLQGIHQHPESWTWFTIDELVAGKNASGHWAYIDALAHDEHVDLKEFLSNAIPESGSIFSHTKAASRAIQIPASPQGLIYVGKSGKQKPLSADLSDDEWSLLLLLAWHRLSHSASLKTNKIELLDAGWARLSDEKLLAIAKRMARNLQPDSIPILDIESDGYCRLDYRPESVFLDPLAFHYEWMTDEPKKKVRLVLGDVETSFASLCGSSNVISLANEFARDLVRIEEGKEPNGDFIRQCRAHFRYPVNLGLRVFASELKGTVEITVPRQLRNF